ncbi:hypothetical protein MH206_20325 [Bacillus altitudinis]|uniref:DUF6602 domain-containing protein n=1 Tax=Bacillus altitudinis TaxID=293387 RepID=UPI00227FA000|nr:DUF6602 domain-containing protein [Bacillus altitudinis]MCY7631364.1 hypothetical protein [Bacillus altitudinis]MDX2366429.1 hypothetical protein [Bacillus altitudinis]
MGETGRTGKVEQLILENYQRLNSMISEEVDFASNHGGLTGDSREVMWMEFFRKIIPKKYSLAQGVIIIDSEGNHSNEVDIAVFDEQYTPYVFQHNSLKFIPIEAVAVAIECKSSNFNVDNLKVWSDNIKKLVPKTKGIARMAAQGVVMVENDTQKRTRPILILASNLKRQTANSSSKMFEILDKAFDFILMKQKSVFHLRAPNEGEHLGWWANELNCYDPERSKEQEGEEKKENFKNNEDDSKDKVISNKLSELRIDHNELLTLNFQLNQLLMLINNPMFFPHYAYAKLFQKQIPK